jgi:hypothetical protein
MSKGTQTATPKGVGNIDQVSNLMTAEINQSEEASGSLNDQFSNLMTAEINQSEEASGSLNDQFSNLMTAEINQSDEANGDNKQVPSLMTSKKTTKENCCLT